MPAAGYVLEMPKLAISPNSVNPFSRSVSLVFLSFLFLSFCFSLFEKSGGCGGIRARTWLYKHG